MRSTITAVFVVAGGLWLSTPALAQQSQGPLQRAEAAYLEIDFEATHRHAIEALRSGENAPEELVRVYQLLGIASSALGREAEARDFFVRMLALDRDAQLDASVPPRLRDPFLEARGVWAARPGRLELEVALDRPRSILRVGLADPSGMARRVVVHFRLEGEARYDAEELGARSSMEVSVPGGSEADRVEYYIDVLDEHGNRMRSEGTTFTPRSIGRERSSAGTAAPAPERRSLFKRPAFWIVTSLVAVAAGATATGMILDRRSRIGLQTGVSIGLDL